MANSSSVLRIRQVRSKIGQTREQREALRTLGLRRIGQVVERPDNAAVRGIVRAIDHLVRVEDEAGVAAAEAAAPIKKAPKKATKKAAKKTTKKSSAGVGKSAKKKPAKKKSSGGSS